jgi:DNA repair exonuclease SbcCD ATPase subunit
VYGRRQGGLAGRRRHALPAQTGERKQVVPTADFDEQRLTPGFQAQVVDLQDQIKILEEEVVTLRRRLQDAPKRVRTLEEKLLETKGELARAVSQNEKLTYTLREAREHIAALREEVDKLTQPPSAYGTCSPSTTTARWTCSAPGARCGSRCIRTSRTGVCGAARRSC